jgi:putative ABC transport system ATP-binding protein
VGAGEVVAVTGPSGSGKSTLLHCLAGIVRPDAGHVRYRDIELSALTEAGRTRLRREHFGVVFQFGQLVPELTAVENVALPLLLAGQRRTDSIRLAREWLERLDAGDVAGLRPGALSGGELQRVAVARALVNRPAVVFADEPTGALDSVAAEKVLGILLSEARSLRAAVVVVTHDNWVAAHAGREVLLRDGQVDDVAVLG